MTQYSPLDRRPIASRARPFWKAVAHFLVRRRASANGISVFGMFAGMAGGAFLAATSYMPAGWERVCFVMAALCIPTRLICNMLDGMVAVESGTASPVGELYNELPDRISDSAVLIGAGYALGGDLALGYAAALAAIFTAYVRAMGKGAGAPSFFAGPMAKQQRMFLVTFTALVLAAFPRAVELQWLGRGWGLMAMALAVIVVLGLFTAARRVGMIARALRAKEGAR